MITSLQETIEMANKIAMPAVEPMRNSVICSMELVQAEEELAEAEAVYADAEAAYQRAREDAAADPAGYLRRWGNWGKGPHGDAQKERSHRYIEVSNLRGRIDGSKPLRAVDVAKGIYETIQDAPLQGGLVQKGLAALRYERTLKGKKKDRYWGAFSKRCHDENPFVPGVKIPDWVDDPHWPEFGRYNHPEWKRLRAMGERHVKVWEKIIDHEQAEKELARMAAAFGKVPAQSVPAGQRVFRIQERETYGSEKSVTRAFANSSAPLES
jgi:hypothetical protein